MVSTGGAGQVPQANAINDKSQSVSAIGIHHRSSHAGGAAQFPRANAINVGSQLVSAIGIHVPSSHAGGAAQFPQAHPINDKAWPLMEGMAMNLENAPISAGGAGQYLDPNAINGMSPFFLPPTSTALRIMPEAMHNSHRHIQRLPILDP